MTDKLKPCPFCGGEGSIDHYGCTKVGTMYSCLDCGTHLETGETFNHGQKWNDRPVEDALRAEVERLREALSLVLPMAKGYAYHNQVGSNAAYIEIAQKALKGTGQ